jgi:hypothetical protein
MAFSAINTVPQSEGAWISNRITSKAVEVVVVDTVILKTWAKVWLRVVAGGPSDVVDNRPPA